LLVSKLNVFNRLAHGEDMPIRRPLGRLRRKLSTRIMARAAVSIWTLTTVAMIALALVLSHVGDGAGATGGCAPSWPATCIAPHTANPPAD
jgi:hypothetical protein